MIIEPFVNNVAHGLVGSLILFGFFGSLRRPKTQVEVLEEENEALRQKYKHVHGQNRLTQDEASYLQSKLGEAQKREGESQHSQERLNEELVRLKRLLRSREIELHQERSKRKDRRKK